MKFKTLLILLLLSMCILVPAGAERIAVLDSLVDEGVDRSVQIPVTEKLIEVFVRRTGYTVIDRTDVQSVLSEKNFQLSGMVKTEEVREVGQYLGADLICLAKVSLVGQTYFLSVKLIDVKNGTIIGQATDESRGSVEVVLRLAETTAVKLLEGNGSLAKTGKAAEKKSENKQDSTVFLFSDPSAQNGQKKDSSPTSPSGNTAPSTQGSVARGNVPSMLMMGFGIPQFIGPAYDSLWGKIEDYYSPDFMDTEVDRWGIGVRLRGFWPLDSNMYIYAEGAGTTDNIDVTTEDDSMVSMLVWEAVVGTGYYMPFGNDFIAYFGAGIGILSLGFEADTDVWDNYSVDSVGGLAYNMEIGVSYFSSPNGAFDFKVSLTSGKLEDEELFGSYSSSEGFGALNYTLMAGLKL